MNNIAVETSISVKKNALTKNARNHAITDKE